MATFAGKPRTIAATLLRTWLSATLTIKVLGRTATIGLMPSTTTVPRECALLS